MYLNKKGNIYNLVTRLWLAINFIRKTDDYNWADDAIFSHLKNHIKILKDGVLASNQGEQSFL